MSWKFQTAPLQELLTKAQSGGGPRDMARMEALLSAEEAALFDAGKTALEAFNRWRFGGRLPSRASLKRRLDSAPANGTR